MEIFIRAMAVLTFSMEAGKPTGINPFQSPDTPKTRDFLYDLVGSCARRLTAATIQRKKEKQIKMAVDTVMKSLISNTAVSSAILVMDPAKRQRQQSVYPLGSVVQ